MTIKAFFLKMRLLCDPLIVSSLRTRSLAFIHHLHYWGNQYLSEAIPAPWQCRPTVGSLLQMEAQNLVGSVRRTGVQSVLQRGAGNQKLRLTLECLGDAYTFWRRAVHTVMLWPSSFHCDDKWMLTPSIWGSSPSTINELDQGHSAGKRYSYHLFNQRGTTRPHLKNFTRSEGWKTESRGWL